MGSLNSTHPGAHEEIYKKGISVCRYNTGIRQSIDGTEEQIFMRHGRPFWGDLFWGGIFSLQLLDQLSYLKPHDFILS